MAFYLSIWAILFFLAMLEMSHGVKDKVLLFLTVLFLLLLAGFRYGIEADYWSYYYIFNNTNYQMGIEIGFIELINIYKMAVSNSYNGFVFFIAFISISIKYRLLKQLDFPAFAVLIYYSLFYIMLEYNGIRQGLAISFLSLSVIYLQKKSFLKFCIFVGIASVIHISSLLFLPVCFLAVRKIYIRTVFLFIFLAIIMRIFFLSWWISTVIEIVRQLFLGRFLSYLKQEPNSFITVGFIRRLVIIILFICINGKKRIYNIYFNIYFIGCIIYILFMGNSVMSTRTSLSFEFFMVPMFANRFGKFTMKVFYIIGMLSFILLLIYIVSLINGYAIPYKSYLFL